MIVLHNDYIFLPKSKKKNSYMSSKGTDDTIRIQMKKNIIIHIKSIFGEPISNDAENTVFKNILMYEIEIKNIMYEVLFTIHNITRYSYLDVCVSGKTTNQVVSAIEYIHDKIANSDIERDYIAIVSYDSISEYYCNKTYPKLNKLERNLRKLLFNTYTVNFGVDYYKKTVSPDLQNKINGVIQAKGNEEKKQIERLKKFFYSMEFSDIQSLLFTKRWTTIEEESKAEFLSKHERLTELSEEDIRTAFDMFSPKSDWERLFADKINNSEIEKMIETVRSTRNDIAHCKFFYKEQYNIFNKAATDLNHLILEAIRLTKENDFAYKQAESFHIALSGIADTLAQFQNQVKEIFYDSIPLQAFLLAMKEWKKSIDVNMVRMLSDIDFSKLATIEDEEDGDEGSPV
ncbi:MAG: Swt1 family HEPN domain-containing protein [Clostridium sp.]|nr:Swt1 family HEPN domain-containing protein [Acetatifactor muris]MCM1527587.1 Swt1 family HEPN domain-containing protein [Bacteroides sp.]MCM1563828.1 Swt1 family HEPN domain-containing protein [Clostridium sp.]